MTKLAGYADEPTPSTKVLLTDGDWTIEELRHAPDYNAPYSRPDFRTARSKYYSLLKHVCYPDGPERHRVGISHVHQVVVYADDSSHCWRCTKEIPEGMVAVWKFQNWEHL